MAKTIPPAAQRTLAGVLCSGPLTAQAERSLPAALTDLPVLTPFGRKNEPYRWQDRPRADPPTLGEPIR